MDSHTNSPIADGTKRKVCELKAVDRRAAALLETVNDINGQLDAARLLRKQRSGLLSDVEKKLMDTTFQNTQRTLCDVATLVETCSVDTGTEVSGTDADTEVMFILRDSPQIPISLNQLAVTSHQLQTTLNILCCRQSSAARSVSDNHHPPSYEESQFLTERRARNLLRKASRDRSRDMQITPDSGWLSNPLNTLAEDGDGDQAGFTTSSYHETNASSPMLFQDELFYDERSYRSPQTTVPSAYIPYRPATASPSSEGLSHMELMPDSLLPRVPRVSTRDEEDLTSAALPEVCLTQNASLGPIEQAITENESPAEILNAVRTPLISAKAQMIDPTVVTTSSPTNQLPDATSIASNSNESSAPPKRKAPPPPRPPKPRSMKVSPDATADLRYKAGPLVESNAPVSTPIAKKDWETLPSQKTRLAGMPTFVLAYDPTEKAPNPSFERMLKLEHGKDGSEIVRRVSRSVSRRPSSRSDSRPSLDSEFPEVVRVNASYPQVTSSATKGSDLPEVVPQSGHELIPGTVVTEVSANLVERIRKKRELEAQLFKPPNGLACTPDLVAPEVVVSAHDPMPVSTSSFRRWSDAAMLPHNSLQTSLPLRAATAAASKPGTAILTGRARSKRWSELQFERSLQLPKIS